MGQRIAVAVPVTTVVLAVFAVLAVALGRQQGVGTGLGVNQLGMAADVTPRPAPPFTLETFAGQPMRLADYRGKTVVVNFWASWCPPCKQEAPVLQQAAQDYRGSGVVILGVTVWDRAQEARTFIDTFGLTYPNAPDDRGEVTVGYGVAGIPETFVIDRDGQLVKKWTGPINALQLRSLIEGGGR